MKYTVEPPIEQGPAEGHTNNLSTKDTPRSFSYSANTFLTSKRGQEARPPSHSEVQFTTRIMASMLHLMHLMDLAWLEGFSSTSLLPN